MHRYRNFNRLLKEEFGERVHRVVIKGGFTCPNRDGSLARGGCTFCNEEGHRPTTLLGERGWPEVESQLRRRMKHVVERFSTRAFIAYFQDYSATYAAPERLRPMFERALAVDGVVGLIVATRSDCLGPEILDLLSELNERTYLWVEIGLQSASDDTLARVRRYHTVQNVADAALALKARGIRVGVHVMLGLPGEGPLDYQRTARFVGEIGFDGIKIHNTYVLKSTVLARQFYEGLYRPQSLTEYVNDCVDFLERIPPEMVVQRLTAQGPKPLMVAPQWCINKHVVLAAIDAELARRDSWQGKRWRSTARLELAAV
ncbi:MAG: TIGR01212 family radical SAM protein [Myxococcales bacterium]|nr:TIGR01212 family radical SAM protein [Myxococcales bacterium]